MNDKIKELFERGLNYTEISKITNLSTWKIKNTVLRNGYKKIGKIRRSRYSLNENYFDIIGEKQLWLIGLLAADGYINIRGSLFSITQSNSYGFDIINYIKSELEYSGPIYTSTTTCQLAYSLYITSEKIVKKLSEFNIINNKTLIYKLPKFKNDYDFRNYIRGYIDGDGSIGIYNNGSNCIYLVISFVGTEEFIKSISEKIPIKYSNIIKLNARNCFEIRWYGKKAVEFGVWCFYNENLFISNKIKIYHNFINNFLPNYDKLANEKIMAKELLDNGLSVLKVSKIINVPFQTIYKWKKKF